MRYLFASVLSFLVVAHIGFAQTAPPVSAPDPATTQPTAAGRPPGTAPRFTGHLSPEPAQFIVDANTMLLATANPNAKVIAEQLQQLWGSNQLTSSQQRTIAALSQQMLDKKYRPVPHLATLYSTLINGKTKAGLNDQQLDQLLDALGQAVAKSPTTEVEKYLSTTSRALGGGYVYHTNFSSLRVSGGQWSFAYKAAAAPDPAASFDSPSPAPTPAPAPAAPAAKPVAAKPKAKPAAKKKRASDGWDTGDLWSSKPSKNDGWGDDGWGSSSPAKKKANDGWGASSDDGWGTPAKKKAPAKAVAKTTPAKAAAATPTEPASTAADFEQANQPFVPSSAAAQSVYYPPAISGPVLELKDADLTVAASGDSLVLHKVTGTVVPGSSRLVATGAETSWTIKGNPVSAVLQGFDFDLSKPEFTAQPVTLTYDALLEAPIKGALSYKATRRKPGATESDYPRFISLTNDARLKGLGEGITYQGGLSVAGPLLRSAALDGSASHLKVSQEGKTRVRIASRNFLLGDSLLTAGRAAVSLYQSTGDSITHPGVELKYTKSSQQLKLLYEKGIYRNTPYTDWYHQVYIRAQMVTWNLREPKIDFAVVTNPKQVSADFESRAFFSNTRYQQLKTINHLHPLQLLVGYSRDHGGQEVLNLHEVALATKTSEENLRSAATGLVREGYVDINPKSGEIILLPKGRAYVGAAREKKDFDNINIHSLSGSGRSATLNLANNELLVRGVESFRFTDDSAAVPITVWPDSGIVRLRQNRDMLFGGRVKTSVYGFKGNGFDFNYNGYYIDMPKIDSLTIRTKPKRVAGKPDLEHRPTDFVLSNRGKTQSGRLFLNDPTNRSGRKRMLRYPSYNSTSGAYVYFNKPDVLGGVYDSTTYFDVPPFTLDSMTTGKSQAGFTGTFHSKALPPIKTALTSQEDGSLGFVHRVPAGGYAMYGGKGKLAAGSVVRLNSQGLQANGTVTYLGATLQSDRFVMYSDSLTGEGKSGSIAASPKFPKVTMPPGYLVHWSANTDSMYLQTPPEGDPVKMYADHTFKGSLLLTPAKLGGKGRLDGPQSYVRSENLTFNNDTYQGEDALLSIKSATAGKPALAANNVDFTYDLKKGYADFKGSKDSISDIDLPYSGFHTSLSRGRWDFKKKRVVLNAVGADSLRSYFTSTQPEQHGLKFKAEAATYDLTKFKLQAKGVPYVAIADSWVLPDSGRVAVLPGGKFQELRRARVLMDSVSKFHELYLGNLVIKSRTEFTGQAKYTFKYANGDSVALTFSDFRPDSSAFQTVSNDTVGGRKRGLFSGIRRPKSAAASTAPRGVTLTGAAKVSASDNFALAPRIGYQGEVTLNSQRRGLAFQGAVRLNFSKQKGSAEWIPLQDTINPKNISLNLVDVKGDDGVPLLAGLFMSDNEPGLYPMYFGTTPNSTDYQIFNADGKLGYDTKNGIYTLARTDVSKPNQYEGTVLTFNETNNHLAWRGPMKMTSSEKNFMVTGAGVGAAVPDSVIYRLHALLGFDIVMPPKSVEALTAGVARFTKNAAPALGSHPDDVYNVAQLSGNQAAQSFAGRKPGAAADVLKLASKQLRTLTLNQVDLHWNAKERAWYSVGRIGLGGIGKQPFNALMEGLLEIKRSEGQDYVELYLEPAPGTFYYFRYEKGLLVTQSLDEKYNYAISSKAKYDYNTATEYGVFLGDLDEVEAFRTRFRRTYFNESAKEAQARRKALAEAEQKLAEEKAAEEAAAAAAAEAKKNKKKKPDEAGSEDGVILEPGAEPEPTKKKKKENDPYGDGVIEPAKPAADPKQKAKPADAKAPDETDKKAKKAPEAQPDPNAEPPVDDSKKSKKKKKKDEAEDPFGDS